MSTETTTELEQTSKPADGESELNGGLAVVYGGDDNWFFSDGITRDFGQNKAVKLLDGETVFCSVQPLKCEPLECGLRIVGTINRDG